MKPRGRLPAALVGAVFALLVFGAAVGLAADPAGVELQASQAKDGAWQLKAQVVDPSGGPVAGTQVRFSVIVDFLGQRRVDLGTAPTDVTGRATFLYRPTLNGAHRLIAETGGEDGSAAVVGQLSVDIEGVASPIAPDPVALPTVRTWAVPVAALVVASVWAVLGFVFLMAVIGIRRARSGGRQPFGSSVREPAPGHVGADGLAGKS